MSKTQIVVITHGLNRTNYTMLLPYWEHAGESVLAFFPEFTTPEQPASFEVPYALSNGSAKRGDALSATRFKWLIDELAKSTPYDNYLLVRDDLLILQHSVLKDLSVNGVWAKFPDAEEMKDVRPMAALPLYLSRVILEKLAAAEGPRKDEITWSAYLCRLLQDKVIPHYGNLIKYAYVAEPYVQGRDETGMIDAVRRGAVFLQGINSPRLLQMAAAVFDQIHEVVKTVRPQREIMNSQPFGPPSPPFKNAAEATRRIQAPQGARMTDTLQPQVNLPINQPVSAQVRPTFTDVRQGIPEGQIPAPMASFAGQPPPAGLTLQQAQARAAQENPQAQQAGQAAQVPTIGNIPADPAGAGTPPPKGVPAPASLNVSTGPRPTPASKTAQGATEAPASASSKTEPAIAVSAGK